MGELVEHLVHALAERPLLPFDVPGGHFFVRAKRGALTRTIAAVLAWLCGAASEGVSRASTRGAVDSVTDLQPAACHVWWAAPGDASPRLYALLVPEERERYERFVHDADRNRFLVARAVTRLSLGSYLKSISCVGSTWSALEGAMVANGVRA
jgi:hypothetical protein